MSIFIKMLCRTPRLIFNKMNHGNTSATIIICLIIMSGSLYQLISVCNLFFSYPTNIFIEKTKFHTFGRQLPAMTFCCNVGNIPLGNKSREILSSFKIQHIIHNMFVESTDGIYKSPELSAYYLDKNIIESISSKYY